MTECSIFNKVENFNKYILIKHLYIKIFLEIFILHFKSPPDLKYSTSTTWVLITNKVGHGESLLSTENKATQKLYVCLIKYVYFGNKIRNLVSDKTILGKL